MCFYKHIVPIDIVYAEVEIGKIRRAFLNFFRITITHYAFKKKKRDSSTEEKPVIINQRPLEKPRLIMI